MKKFFAAGIACAMLCCMLSSCAAKELYERLLIHGIGVDLAEDGYLVTVRSSSSAEDEGEELYSARGETVSEALEALADISGRQPFYAHNYLVVFGRECAEQGLDGCMDFFVSYYNTRPAVRMYIAEDRAQDILSLEVNGEYLKMSSLQELSAVGEENGSAVSTDILGFINGAMREGSASAVPVVKAGESGAEIVSTAYFNGYRLAGTLTKQETAAYLAAVGRLKRAGLSLTTSFGKTGLSISACSSDIDFEEFGENGVRFLLNVTLSADISEVSPITEKLSAGQTDEIKAKLEKKLSDEISAIIQKAVTEGGADIFGFGRLVYKSDSRLWQELSSGAQSCDLEYSVSVTADISGGCTACMPAAAPFF